MHITKSVIVLLALCSLFSRAAGQNTRKSPEKQVFVDYGDRFYGEAIAVPTSSGDSASLLVFFRMANDFLTFTKVTDRKDINGNFKADMAVSIEIRDSIGVIRHRIPWRGTAYVNSYEETNSKTDFHFGSATVKVAPNTYSITLEILSQKESNQRRLALPAVAFHPRRTSRTITTPIIAETEVTGDVDQFKPYVFGGNIPFQPQDASALVLVADSVPTEWTVRMVQKPYEEKEIRWWNVGDAEYTIRSLPGYIPSIADVSSTDRPVLTLSNSGPGNVATLVVPVPVTALVPGSYTLSLRRKGASDSLTVPLKVYWEMMPLSLRNLSYAVSIMRYIVDDAVLDSIDDGTDVERRSKLMDFWRRRDPSPATTFNEQLAEYYRRVDKAFYLYSTITEPDGAKSERGKIYILHGSPSSVKKAVGTGDRQQEIWAYSNKVRRSFTFEVDDAGVYRLRAIDPPEAPRQN